MRPALVVAILALAPLAGCSAPSDDARPDVMASFYPIQFLASRIAGDNVTVGVVAKPGVEPHDYEPTPSDLARIHDAKLLLTLGAGFEEWIGNAREHAPGTPVAAVGGELAAERGDPHVWLDPVLMQKMARRVEAALSSAFPAHAPAFQARAAALDDDLGALHGEFEQGLARCEVRVIVTSHAAFGYMAQRYGFEMLAMSGLDPDAEPTPETLREVVEAARAHSVKVIYFEELVSPDVARVVAREVNATTRVLSPVESIAPEDAARGVDYLTRMREDLDALQDGMRCS